MPVSDLLLAGLANGAVYAALALALVVVYQGSGHINYAQGEMATLSAYLAWTLLQLGMPYWWSFTVTVIVSFAAGVLIQRLLLARLRSDAGALTPIAVLLGLYLVCHGFSGWRWGHSAKAFPSPFAELFPAGLLSTHELGTLLLTLAALLLFYLFLTLTPAGLALRAAAHNPLQAPLFGVRVERAVALSWGAAAALGAVAGMLIAPTLFLHPQMMSGVLIYSFAGAVVGGLDNPLGAVIGALLVGLLEALAGAYLPFGSELKLTLALTLIVAVLWARPRGLFAGQGDI